MLGDRTDSDDAAANMSQAEQLDLQSVRADLRDAYDRGRTDERASRRRHPVFMALTFLAAVCGLVLLGLAAVNGSFAEGGAVADRALGAALSQAEPQARAAAGQVSQSLRDAASAAKPSAANSSS